MREWWKSRYDDYRDFVTTERGKTFSRIKNVISAGLVIGLSFINPIAAFFVAAVVTITFFLEFTVDFKGVTPSGVLSDWFKGRSEHSWLLALTTVVAGVFFALAAASFGIAAMYAIFITALIMSVVFIIF